MNNLKTVLQNLKSDKIKERQEGLGSIRTVFAQDKVVANFHIDRNGKGDPRAWLSVFQALFQAVLNEKLAATKKTTSKSAGSAVAAQKRLSEAASAVRWLTERTSELMNKRVVKALLEHLLQTMVHKGEMLVPVALDYIKALRCIVSFTPHLEHMEDDTWIRIVEMGFNVVLGDPIKSTFELDSAAESPARGTEADDSDLYDENEPMGDGDNEDMLPSTSKKRPRSDSSSAQRPSFSKSASQSNRAFQRQSSVTVSLEQIEFMSIISILLRSPSAPILAANHDYLPSSILLRLERFLDVYPADTSLVQDYISTVSSTLAHLSLNRTHDVARFARKSWNDLVGLWGTKNKRMKEGLVAVLRVLFPFVTTDNEIYQVTPFDCAESIGKLWHLLEGEAESRWGVEGLSLESLRLELIGHPAASPDSNTAFVAETFRSGWNFDAGQALAWAILELQADCAGKLFQLSESMHISSTPGSSRSEGKRIRLESPIASLLSSIQDQSAPNIRAYHLQTLLFFIDRHWSIVHHSLQQDVVQALLQCVSFDDGNIQSWALLCFGAIAHAGTFNTPHSRGTTSNERSSPLSKSQVQSAHSVLTWDSIWTNAIRRANVPTVCRAACHTAHILLVNSQPQIGGDSRIPLSSQRILSEIEALGKDLDVQGPVYPYDSVCTFLSQCLKIAGQDMRLYRMQLEEKVLSWLIDCWKVVGMGRKRMSLHAVKDLMLLLENICGHAKRSNLLSRVPLPGCQIVEVLVEEAKAKVIRDFLLNARLPPFGQVADQQMNGIGTSPPGIHKSPERTKNDPQLAQPRGRERKLSTFFLRTLEGLVSEWEDSPGHPTAETARRSLDMAVTALSFESALVLNGTQPNRRLIQCACKLAGIVTGILRDARWTTAEKALVLLGLDPLLFTGKDCDNGERWKAMLPPDIGTGIKSQSLKHLNPDETNKYELGESRMMFLRIIWQHPDVQDAFIKVADTIRIILRATLNDTPPTTSSFRSSDRDDRDDFGPIRTTAAQQTSEMNEDDRHSRHHILEICVAFLTVGPNLQSASGEPTRDNELMETVLDCAEDRHQDFFLILPIFLEKVRQRILNITAKNLDSLLSELGRLLELYAYARSQYLQTLTTQLLNSTLDFWTPNEGTIGDILHKVQLLCAWLSGALKKQKIRPWRVRDSLARFLDAYLLKDQREMAWAPRKNNETDEEKEGRLEVSPTHLLPFMNSDEDIRVRFRVAVINARLFAVARILQSSPMEMYDSIKRWYTKDIDNYEHILTRILSLGNIMVVSSAVRRGPYWHLLETCLYSPHYSRHIESVLRGVSERMGLANFSVLFTSYASQLAFSIRKVESDILRFPPHLLGYRDRKECAELTFRSFTPTNVWQGGDKLFQGHCKVLQKTVKSGLHECFGDILGYRIMTWVDEYEFPSSEMEELLQSKTFRSQEFEDALNRNIDGIIASILRTLGDQDFSDDGPIATALHMTDQTGKTSRIFHALVKHRRIEDFDSHQPNLPVFPAETILRALTWLRTRLPNTDMKATTYHILHQLFADVEQSPLVNEQLRVMNAISVWIAWLNEEFDDLTLLHTIIQGATSLLTQTDLARSSQSIIEWAFDRYRARKTKDPRFPDIIIRIACLSHDYTCNAPNLEVAKMGNELCQWIDNEALKVSKVVELKSQILRALPAWPHEPSTHLAKLYETITAESLSGVLGDNRMSSNKFRLVRRLNDPAILKNYHGGKFTQSDFWRLKESIPTMDRLQEADIDAFVALLFRNKGAIDSFGSDRPDSAFLLSKYRRSMEKLAKSTTEQIDKAKEFVVLTLLEMLQSDSASKVNIAYRTLRLIKSASTDDFTQVNLWPSEHQTELEYFGACQPHRKMRSPRDITELSMSELFSESIKDFSRWMANITILLTDILSGGYPFYAQLTDILQSDIVFAEVILPVLVHTLLMVEKANTEPQAASHRTTLSNYFSMVLSSDLTSIPCLRSIVGVVLHLRYSSLSRTDALCYNKWLDIDFTLLSRSAITCGAYTTALLFLELAAEDRTSGVTRGDDTSEEQILYEIYRHIDEPDGFYGIDDNDLHQFLMKRFHHEKQWEKAFRFHGATLEAGGARASDTEGLVNSFHSFGFDHLAIDTLQSLSNTNNGSSSSPSTSYRLGWRTETWDLPDRNENTPGVSLYLALRAVHRERDSHIVNNIIQHGLSQEMSRLRVLGPENLAEIRETVQDLMSLREITKWRAETIQNQVHSRHLETAYWKEFIDIDQGFEFSNLENIMATRISLIHSVRQKEERQRIGTFITPFAQSLIDVEKKCLVRLSEAARDANQIQIALNSVVRAQLLEKTPSFSVLQEFASVLWVQMEERVAVQYLSRLASSPGTLHQHIEESVDLTQQAALLARLGTWSSEACLKKPADINSQYMTKAVKLLEAVEPTFRHDSSSPHALVYHECAIFAERQYQSIINSPDVIRWKMYVDRKRQEIQSRNEEIQRTTENFKKHVLNQNQDKAMKLLEEDIKSFDRHNEARETFLKQAIEMYSQCLKTSNTFDVDGAIRLCSLWFANFDEDGVQDGVRVALERVPSQKFVFLAHQLSARISTPEAGPTPKNQQSLQALVMRMCQDHPFHSLYQVYCLKPEHTPGASSRRQSGRHNPSSTQNERAMAAGSIFDRLRTDPMSRERVRQVEKLSDACIEWAKYPIKDISQYKNARTKYFSIPTEVKITKISNLQVPIMTHDTPLDPTMRYDNCAWIEKYEKTFETAGGINLPKINLCYDTSGKKHKQLFKGEGNDDLRQDAVMEQVFQLVNNVLSRDRETRRRDLNIRCYKVVPLTSQAGVLEFVGNTLPLKDWLVKAHPRYRPNDLSHNEASKLLIDKQKELTPTIKTNHKALIENFKLIKERFKPVMRHYFTERHKTPISWFAMRLKYTRSVATTSIVGHILGLGDRHISNILLDNGTGQVIHIDLGIAFEQGKLLKIAETVPFRMTRDMVDGMGTSGTKGVFQRCAEETLRVLREDSEVIMTVLEVFKHDPLHSWTASDIKVQRAQKGVTVNPSNTTGRFGIGIDMSSGTAEEAADRALSSVARKLDKALSVQYTVNQLVTDATHDDNLGVIFSGWSPHY